MSPKECEGIPLNCQERRLKCPLDIKGSFGSLTVPGFAAMSRTPSRRGPVPGNNCEIQVMGEESTFLQAIFKRRRSSSLHSPAPAVTRTLHIILTSDYPALWLFMLVSVPCAGFQGRGGQTPYLILCMSFGATSLIFGFSRLSNRDNRTYCVQSL